MNNFSELPDFFSPEALDSITPDEFESILKKNKESCLFCEPSSSKKILLQTPNFYVTFDDSPLIEGHIMIHTKVHFGCGGEIPEDNFSEFVQLKQQLKQLLATIYGACSFYEHGRAGHCSISNNEILCEHFHLHALPLKEDISSNIQNHFEEITLSSIHSLPQLYEQYDQYLLYENENGIKFYPVLGEIPSHFLRTVISKKIGKPERANWEEVTDLALINNLKQKIKRIYDTN